MHHSTHLKFIGQRFRTTSFVANLVTKINRTIHWDPPFQKTDKKLTSNRRNLLESQLESIKEETRNGRDWNEQHGE